MHPTDFLFSAVRRIKKGPCGRYFRDTRAKLVSNTFEDMKNDSCNSFEISSLKPQEGWILLEKRS